MDRHFSCTACSKCCYGMLPLTIPDALAHAHRFPLFLMWAPMRPGGRSYDLTARLGFTLKLKNKKEAAVRITPVSYLPSALACPVLGDDGLCTVHDTKPLRCKAMPLSGSRAEDDQADLLLPKPGWDCDTSDAATLVYRNKTIVDRTDVDAERAQLERDAAVLQPFAGRMFDSLPDLRMQVMKMAQRPQGGSVITSFKPLVLCLSGVDISPLAAQQVAVLDAVCKLAEGRSDCAKEYDRYTAARAEWAQLV